MKRKNNFTELAIQFKYNKTDRNYTELFNALKRPLLKFINGIVKDPAVSSDIFQDVAIKIFEKIDMYNENFNFSTWVYTISRNECLIHLKKLKSKPRVSLSHQGETGIEATSDNSVTVLEDVTKGTFITEMEGLEDPNIIDEKYEETLDLINELDEKYKIFLIEKYVNNLKEKEIAEKFGVSKSTVKNRLFHGRKKIQKLYAENNTVIYQ